MKKTKVISIHQPHFFPWGGYINKIINSDIFVFYDIVQFTKNNFQNRNRIKNANGQALWISLPVNKDCLDKRIFETRISDLRNLKKIEKTIFQLYRKSAFFDLIWNEIEPIFKYSDVQLSGLDFEILKTLLKVLKIETQILVSSHLNIQSNEPTERLSEICSKLGGSHYIAGRSGVKYMDMSYFEKKGIEILWQEYKPNNFVYDQLHGDFIPGLSILDALFNIGPDESKKLLKDNWTVDGQL